MLDSFKDYPKQIEEFGDYQQFHLPFRLVIVERPERVISFLIDRIKRIKPKDILVASFLHLDEKARDNYSSMGFLLKNESEGIATFEKSLFKGTRNFLISLGANEDDLTVSNSAFSVHFLEKIISNIGGKILQMSLIPTETDEKKPITTIGVILSKA